MGAVETQGRGIDPPNEQRDINKFRGEGEVGTQNWSVVGRKMAQMDNPRVSPVNNVKLHGNGN